MHTKPWNILKIFSEEGIFSFFLRVLVYINKNICGLFITYIYELDLEKYKQKIFSNLDLSFRFAKKKEINRMNINNYNYDLDGKKYSIERLLKGDKCLLAIFKGKIVGYEWIMNQKMELSESNYITLSKKRVYCYKAFVLKEFRRMKVTHLMDVYLFHMFIKSGKRFVILTVDMFNKPAIKSRERAGFKKIAYIIRFRFFGLNFDYINKKSLIYLQNP